MLRVCKILCLAALALALDSCAGVSRDGPRGLAGIPGKLPKTVVPIRYEIELKPDLNTLALSGSEAVDIEVLQPTAEVTLNAVDLTLESASVEGGQAARITVDPAAQTAALTFAQPLERGRHRLRIAFSGRVNRFSRGLFFVDYPAGAGRKRMLATHLEPADARRIFPSWDEPAFKASFALSVTVPQAFLAVSNMPVAAEQPVDAASKRVSFAETPRMSSYLFVFVAGELERLERDYDGVRIGVVATAGKRAQGSFALDSAVALLAYYNDYFGVKYPLPKLDLIAVPGGIGGAMENWGGITFSENILLFSPATSPPGARRSTFGVIAHEMAHLWFGDLVTMAWWDDLWLNEGFASWMQAKAADRLHPDWQAWLNASGAKQGAMRTDARRTSHPIQQPVANESEAMAAFDGITYSKGQAFIRMLEEYLGEEAFRAGVRAYMREHAYGNATTADLWRALRGASGKPVEGIAGAYIEQAGVPLVVSEARCERGRQQISLRQERFTVRDPDARAQRWPVPVAYGPAGAGSAAGTLLLEGEARIAAGACGEPVKLNLGDVGYYRVQYDDPTWKAFARSMAALGTADRVNLLADAWALVEAGKAPPERFFDLVGGLPDDSGRAAWAQVMRVMEQVDFLERGRPGRGAFQAYARARLRPVFERLGWEERRGESSDDGLLRPELIRRLGDLGDAGVLAEAQRRFAAFVARPASLRPGLRNPVTALAGRACDRATCELILGLARKSTGLEERRRYYFAVAGSRDPAIARETLALALSDELPNNFAGGMIGTVASGGEHAELAWEFVQGNFASLEAKMGPNYANSVPGLLTNLSDGVRAAELVAGFAPAQRTSGGRIQAARADEAIAINTELRERLLPAVDAWLRRTGGPAPAAVGLPSTPAVRPART
jgi:aminopeptidase N